MSKSLVKNIGEDEEIFERMMQESIKKDELRLSDIKAGSKIKLTIPKNAENTAGIRRYKVVTGVVIGLYNRYIRIEYKNKYGVTKYECFNRVDLARQRFIKYQII